MVVDGVTLPEIPLEVFSVLKDSLNDPDHSPQAPPKKGSWTWWRLGPHPQGVWIATDWQEPGWAQRYEENHDAHPWYQDQALGPPSDFGSRICHSCDYMSDGYPEPDHHTVCDGICMFPGCTYHPRPTQPGDQITQARKALAESTLTLASLLRELCPSQHRYVQHRDAKPPWCPSCGYGRDGVRYHE